MNIARGTLRKAKFAAMKLLRSNFSGPDWPNHSSHRSIKFLLCLNLPFLSLCSFAGPILSPYVACSRYN